MDSDRDQQETSDAVFSSEEMVRRIYHSIDAAVLVHDPESGTILDCNETACALFGHSRDELRGTTMAEFSSGVPPATRQRIVDRLDQATDGEPTDTEWLLEDSDGNRVPVEVSLSELPGEGGSYVLATLRELETGATAPHADILNRMTDAFFALDRNRQFTYLNERGRKVICEAIGEDRTVEELEGQHIWEEIPQAKGTTFYEKYEHALDSGETVVFESYYEPLDTWFEINAYPSESGLSVFFRDVTEERRTTAELEATVENLHDLYVIASDTDREFGERLDRMIGLGTRRLDLPYGFLTRITEGRQEIVTSRGDHELLQPGETCPLEQSYCKRTIDSEGILAVFDALDQGWGDDVAYDTFELGCYLGGKVIVDGELYGTLCFAASKPKRRDFTESELTFVELASRWISYELERQQYREELERQNDRLGKFASVVSHDLRNPLNAATTQIELAQEECDSDHLDAVARSHDRMAAIITDLLTLAREGEDSISVTTVSLPECIEESWRTVGTARADLTVETDGRIRADGDRLRRLFENLFRNAIEHADPDVALTVGDLADGFYVEDDGPGIPEDERERIFESGYSTSADGTGFGLSLVERIVDAHGWEITVTEGTTGGARFEITGTDAGQLWDE